MPFIPHTPQDRAAMLKTIGVDRIEELFDEVPVSLQAKPLDNIPSGINELLMTRLMHQRAACDRRGSCFLGAGAYEHHIPAAVWDIASRGEFMTAYTPYQAEASQGTLQLLYEFQTMMAGLMHMEVSNASLYDGASATAEAILMAVRSFTKQHHNKRVLVAGGLHPHYRQTIQTIVASQGIELIDIPLDTATGRINPQTLEQYNHLQAGALVIPQPNFFGQLEDVDTLTNFAHAHGQLVIAVVNPLAMALFKEPGSWGETGADIACGEGQPLGVPMASGGPYFGFMCTRMHLVRQMPGRIVGRTTDRDGKPGFTLTLQAREQHIRRAKATSNICTNQGLAVTAATIFMSLLGEQGLRKMALASVANTQKLVQLVTQLPDVKLAFTGPHFHEVTLRLPIPAAQVVSAMATQGIEAGYDVGQSFPQWSHDLIVCATETKTDEDLQYYAQVLQEVLASSTTTSVNSSVEGVVHVNF